MRINFDAILERALRGVRRSYVFMGLGVNSSEDERLQNYQLTPVTKIQLLEDGLSEEVVADFKGNYREWVINSAFRDSLESFHVFVEQIFLCLILIKKKAPSIEHVKKDLARFEKLPFPSKLEALKKDFGVEPDFINHIKSINKTRNCMSHRRCVVSSKDFNNKEKTALVLRWRGLNMVLTDKEGQREGHMSEFIGTRTKHETDVGLRFVDREKVFLAGQIIRFEPRELAEVLWYWTMEIQKMARLAVEYAKTSGVTIVDPRS
jgi:hypothetical protein